MKGDLQLTGIQYISLYILFVFLIIFKKIDL